MKKILLFVLTFLLFGAHSTFAKVNGDVYAIAKGPTPVLYTPDFKSVFGGTEGVNLMFDDYGEIDPVEFIALKDTVFKITDAMIKNGNIILKVETKDYPYSNEKGYYIDYRFVKITTKKPEERKVILPTKLNIIKKMLAASGSIYTWGGNVNEGIPEMLKYYKPTSEISQDLKDQWMLKGVDCSGLLYWATNGYTPRNTSDLVKYGTGLDIEGKTSSEIQQILKPLDIIAWGGHTIIVLDKNKTIESKVDYESDTPGFQGGVRIRNTKEVLDEILSKRIAVNDYSKELGEGIKKFAIRRWY